MSVCLSKITRVALAVATFIGGAVATAAVSQPAAYAAQAGNSVIGGAVATAAVSQPAAYAAQAGDSVIGGPITRAEVIARAQSWLGQNIPYDQGGSYPDPQGTNYRTDCSGYVSMAWHLGSSANTEGLADSYTNQISRSDLKPGDILNSYYNHVILFEKWDDAAHTTFDYYSFGSTPVKHVTGVSINAAYFESHPSSEYVALRYKNIIDGNAGTESGSGRVRFADWDGDGRADYIVVNDDGSVHVYLNRGGDGHGGWLDDGVVATGLTTDKSRVRFADWDGDGRADYIAINPDGKIHVMLNRGGAGHGGWQDAGIVAQGTTTNPDQVRFADIDGDGKTDYVTIADDGIVSAYLNRGGDTGGGWVVDGQIATGVTTDRSRVRLADIDGDGRADYVVLNPDGSVTAYVNNGGVGHFNGWSLRPKIASGVTTNQNLVNFADLNGDGLADYLVTNGPTHAFINNGGEDVRNPGWIDWGQVAAGGV